MGAVDLGVGGFQRLQDDGGDDTGPNSAQVGVEGQYTGVFIATVAMLLKAGYSYLSEFSMSSLSPVLRFGLPN